MNEIIANLEPGSNQAPVEDPAVLYRRETYPLLVVLSGPSGVGKDSVLHRLKERQRDPFHFVITVTTRSRREGEIHGRDYFFVSISEFAELLEQDELLEHATVYNHYYGIPKQQVREALASGKDVIMRIDVQGAATIRALVPEAVFIFLMAESEAELIDRLRARKTEAADALKMRIVTARGEMRRVGEFEYRVVNRAGRLDEAVDQIMAIIRAEHCRVKPRRIIL